MTDALGTRSINGLPRRAIDPAPLDAFRPLDTFAGVLLVVAYALALFGMLRLVGGGR